MERKRKRKEKKVFSYTLGEIAAITENSILPYLEDYNLVCLLGDLGSGKTSLVKQILTIYGIEIVTSPTYNIINEYHCERLGTVYHVDLYRLENAEEMENIGIFELIERKKRIFIEWPELILQSIPYEYLRIELESVDDFSMRQVTICPQH